MRACTVSNEAVVDSRPHSGIDPTRHEAASYALAVLCDPAYLTTVLMLIFSSSTVIFLRFGWTVRFWCLVPLLIALAIIVVTDFSRKLIPDVITLPGLAYALVVAAFTGSPSLTEAVFGALVGGGTVFLLAVISRGAFGGGDIKLLAMFGAALGWKAALAVLALSQVVTAVLVLIFLITGQATRHTFFPIGAIISILGMVAILGAG